MKASLALLEKNLKQHHKKTNNVEDERPYTRAVSRDQIARVVDLVRPLYDEANDRTARPNQITEGEIAEFSEILRGLGLKLDALLPVPSTKPAIAGTSKLIELVLSQETWSFGLRRIHFHQPTVSALYRRLTEVSCTVDPAAVPANLGQSVAYLAQNSRSDLFVPLARQYPGLERVIATYAKLLVVSPRVEKNRDKKISDIERVFSRLVRWPILGYMPESKKTLCILVA